MLIPTLFLAALPQGPQTWSALDRTHLPADLPAFPSAALIDHDGDGDLDLVAGGASSTRFLVNDGKARFRDAAAGIFPTGVQIASSPAVGDFDGDGDADLVAPNGSRSLAFLRNDGGTFSLAGSAISGSPQTPRAADLDGDGDLDLVVREQQRVAVFLNDGAGRFTDVGPRGLPVAMSTRDVELGDVDGDGDTDVLVGNQLITGGAFLFLNDGSGRFTQSNSFPLNSTDAMRLADLDRDGDLDIVAHDAFGQGSDDRLTVLVNDGTGRFTDAGARGLPTIRFGESFTLGDFDGDGAVDVVRFAYRSAMLARNDGSGAFPASGHSDLPDATQEVQLAFAADLDGDLDTDLLGSSLLRPHLLLNLDRGTFTEAVTRGLPTNRLFTRDAHFADVNRDGYPELLAWGSTSNAVLLRNVGGSFTVDERFPAITDEVRGVVFEDLNGDGAADAYLCFGFGADLQDRLFLNRRGTLQEFTTQALPQDPDRTWAPFAADLDGDGKKDLVMRRSTAPVVRILLQQADGTFTAGGSVDGLPTQFALLGVGDIDGDGAADLFTSAGVFRNDGTARFSPAPGLAPPLGSVVMDAELGDLDGDGDLDAYVARSGFGSAGGQDLLLENQGGVLVDVTLGHLPVALDQTTRSFAADLDGDGDLDLYGRNNDGQKFLRNDGGLRFAPMTVHIASPSNFGVFDAADTDRDGDVDLAGFDRIETNLAAQIHAPLLPQVGADYPLDCYSAAGARMAALVLSPRQAFQEVPGLGFLGVDLPLAYPLGSLAVPGDGSAARLTTPIPALAALIGQTFWVQGILVDNAGGGRLTNVLAETIH